MISSTGPLLTVNDLSVMIATENGVVRPVRGVSFEVQQHETLGIIGESGCGKSVTAESIMGLLDPGIAAVRGGVRFNGRDLLGLSARARRAIQGNTLSMIFQDPLSSLNPLMTIGRQIDESLRLHAGLPQGRRKARIIELLSQVGINDPLRCSTAYPHEISGGMRQRVMIAMAIACHPALLIADEPTTALDVTIQAQILALLESLKAANGMGIILITHDLSVVAQMCQRVIVMYLGEVVEEADVMTLFDRPRHPYTRGLMAAIPGTRAARKSILTEIKGSVPPPSESPAGCGFAPRCPFAGAICRRHPPLDMVSDGGATGGPDSPRHAVRCWKAGELDRGTA
ncbi:ABC transporter ATP-binding protein [Acerihabitans arboris]|uniref:ABC-type dipeptide transporter n=1 Tax=Acerihabitans arboris TaxID=2691583 RepID=A0A845SD80_9GAMM|nr:ABC transporter ATP-binding protein [Acerihabitans arboris]NDL61859.1 ATP-binding cassette domain-containing protein [Acerihabitans arboris]